MKEIELARGCVALVDDEDGEWINLFSWHVLTPKLGMYAATRFSEFAPLVLMHRIIMNASEYCDIDHKDGNGLNNQKDNLRFSTRSQNMANMGKTSLPTTSKYKGVAWYKRDQNWSAQIYVHYKKFHLGYFDVEEDAARAYNEAAKAYFGEFARLNEV